MMIKNLTKSLYLMTWFYFPRFSEKNEQVHAEAFYYINTVQHSIRLEKTLF